MYLPLHTCGRGAGTHGDVLNVPTRRDESGGGGREEGEREREKKKNRGLECTRGSPTVTT